MFCRVKCTIQSLVCFAYLQIILDRHLQNCYQKKWYKRHPESRLGFSHTVKHKKWAEKLKNRQNTRRLSNQDCVRPKGSRGWWYVSLNEIHFVSFPCFHFQLRNQTATHNVSKRDISLFDYLLSYQTEKIITWSILWPYMVNDKRDNIFR